MINHFFTNSKTKNFMRTRSLFFSIAAFLCCSFTLQAQVNVNFGLKGGANFSTFIGSEALTEETLIAPHLGALAQITIGEDNEGFLSYALQPEIVYSMQGAKIDNQKTVLSYVNIPIMIQRYVASSGFYIESGPQVGFLVSAKAKADGISADIKSELKPVDFALNVGLGYKFGSGFGINARYNIGLTSIDKNGSDVKNATISAVLFYVLGCGGE
jgi:hypothetical protein